MKILKVNPDEISIGKALPWAVYDRNERLLLNKGEIIASERQLITLLEHGLYRKNHISPNAANDTTETVDEVNPFELMREISLRLKNTFRGLAGKRPESIAQLGRISHDIQKLCEKDADAALGAIHLLHDSPYPIWHPIHVALLCELITRRMGIQTEERLPILNAALTCNIAMNELQEMLYQQDEPLSDEQKAQIRLHCEQGAAIMRDAGVEDPLWLNIILQHHEKVSGDGYPAGLKEDEILKEARIAALADRYSAMISPRGYRKGMPAQNALRELFLQKGKEYDESLSILFIKELGVYPPGIFVKLENGETAIVVKRGKESTHPVVCSLISPFGGRYLSPLQRDCSKKGYAIKEIYFPDRDMPLNLHVLWGFA